MASIQAFEYDADGPEATLVVRFKMKVPDVLGFLGQLNALTEGNIAVGTGSAPVRVSPPPVVERVTPPRAAEPAPVQTSISPAVAQASAPKEAPKAKPAPAPVAPVKEAPAPAPVAEAKVVPEGLPPQLAAPAELLACTTFRTLLEFCLQHLKAQGIPASTPAILQFLLQYVTTCPTVEKLHKAPDGRTLEVRISTGLKALKIEEPAAA